MRHIYKSGGEHDKRMRMGAKRQRANGGTFCGAPSDGSHNTAISRSNAQATLDTEESTRGMKNRPAYIAENVAALCVECCKLLSQAASESPSRARSSR